jgi:hypothetical protein
VPKHYLLAVRVFFERLLAADQFTNAFAERVGDIRNKPNVEDAQTVAVLDALPHCDAILSAVDDIDDPGYAQLIDQLRTQAGLGDIPIIRLDAGTGEVGDLADATNILVLTLGTVTGWTLRQLRIAVEEATEGRPHHVSGLVLHARPTSARDWETMCNSFSRRLGAIWLTYFPWGSPLRDESELLSVADAQRDTLTPRAAAFLDQRIAYCSPDDALVDWHNRLEAFASNPQGEADPYAVLWGMHLDTATKQLRGQSLYGFELDPLTTYAAMGSAVHRRRTGGAVRTAPEWRMFEVPAIVRSYFDAMMIASVLRWISPQEAWWGATIGEARQTMMDLLTRTKDHHGDLVVLLPELLLATAQGKVHPSARAQLLDSLPPLTHDWSAEELAPIELGRLLLRATG